MSLLNEAMEDFVMIDVRTVSDGQGGFMTQYTDGATVKCGMTLDSSIQAKIAMKQGVTSVYTLITDKAVILPFHQVLRRLKDGKTFRITSDGTDSATPMSANLNMRKYSAEEWVLDNE